ncbi:hypothetical protein BJF79_14555 [Actinomadura sp. CNU-125]|uniref:divisome protein SepX/GlpR n=1 Tax=Actinomadura sp. CNU-125 TaxID=1904961 RepID=UPI0009652813|nr:hypothetical protein [Actinomadura sp. CNU-125]OLT23359.1 hypothetical protein BJF79_14555 [Actinomadura sp. CNU-125]
MSSAVLYLAIVAVWAVVLVPMWLRRDSEKQEDFDEEHTEPEPRRVPSRAKVIARRRRRTAGLTALLATTVTIAAFGVAPWWIIAPAAVLLAGHLSLLRVAVGMDAARREATARARAAAARRAAETVPEPAPAEPAEIIELPTPEEVFDQYADDRRAVGE